MKTKHHILLLLLILVGSAAFSQQLPVFQIRLKQKNKLRGPLIALAEPKSKGNVEISDLNSLLKEKLAFCISDYPESYISWRQHALFSLTNNKNEANMVIEPVYTLNEYSGIHKKLLREKGSFAGGSIPYFEYRKENSSELNLILNYKYKDGTASSDTIEISNVSELKPGKPIKSVEELHNKTMESLNSNLSYIFNFLDFEKIWYKFRPVKSKDKGLKEELKRAKDLAKNEKINELGTLYLKVYNADKSNTDAAFNVAMCYEIIGNYEKAASYYSVSPDFHAKIRMKKNLELIEYLRSIGANISYGDF